MLVYMYSYLLISVCIQSVWYITKIHILYLWQFSSQHTVCRLDTSVELLQCWCWELTVGWNFQTKLLYLYSSIKKSWHNILSQGVHILPFIHMQLHIVMVFTWLCYPIHVNVYKSNILLLSMHARTIVFWDIQNVLYMYMYFQVEMKLTS